MTSARSPKLSRHRLPIVDQEALKFVLEALVEREGSQEKAGALIGLTQGSFSKLANGDRDAIEFATYRRLMAVLGGGVRQFGRDPRPVLEFIVPPTEYQVGGLWRAIRAGQATAATNDPVPKAVADDLTAEGVSDPELEDVRQRLIARLEREARGKADLFDALERCVTTDDHDFVWAHWEWWMGEQLKDIKPLAAPIVRELWGRPEYRPAFERFLADTGRAADELPPEDDLRCWLALCRAVAPFGDAVATWGVERAWKEMHQLGELGTYLNVSLRREELLLRPCRDSERVARGKPPMSYGDWLGEQEILDGGGQSADPEMLRLLEEMNAGEGESGESG
jgi:hypothetical protein